MHPLRITLIQTDLHWENVGANLASLEEKFWQIEGPTDVILLPEMFSTGFTMNAAPLAEVMGLTTFRWLKQMAAQTGALVIGSFIARSEEAYFNRLVWMEPSGAFKSYDKRHLFRMAHEEKTYAAGKARLIGEWKGWKILPLICYDLRFPVWCRNRYDRDNDSLEYDVMTVVANWPTARIEAWNTLLKARAIENLMYTVGVNRTGTDGTGIDYAGRSGAYGPRGEELLVLGDHEQMTTITLDAAALHEFRRKFPAFRDGDEFTMPG